MRYKVAAWTRIWFHSRNASRRHAGVHTCAHPSQNVAPESTRLLCRPRSLVSQSRMLITSFPFHRQTSMCHSQREPLWWTRLSHVQHHRGGGGGIGGAERYG